MNIQQHKELLKLLEKLRKDTCAGWRIFKEFEENLMDLLRDDK
jgi:hypothetical protein